jgi:hypothetical protein
MRSKRESRLQSEAFAREVVNDVHRTVGTAVPKAVVHKVDRPPFIGATNGRNRVSADVVKTKPFNFILSCHVRKLGHPVGADPERFHLIAPYETDPRKWETMQWIDQYSKDGKSYRISTSALHGSRTMARVKSYGDVLREYEYHPEAKCADANGAPCKKQTVGLLRRRRVLIDGFTFIGKESN